MNAKYKLFIAMAAVAVLGLECSCFGKSQSELDQEKMNRESFEASLKYQQELAKKAATAPAANLNVPTYTAPAKPPADQGTIKVSALNCPGADYLDAAQGGTAANFVKLKDGNCYAAWQFSVAEPHQGRCDDWHLHDGKVTAINGTTATDPLPGEGACGFGILKTIQEGIIYINPEQYKRVYNR